MDPSQTRPQATRPRARSGFSFSKSNKTLSSDGSPPQKSHKRQESFQETAAEKRKIHMSETTKANPNAAIQEAQPSAAALEQSTLQTMDNIRFTDIYGRAIEGEPDKSNPTRSRHERPLDTIRGFEYAIDKAYAQRQSAFYQGGPGDTSAGQSRRSSAYWNGNNNSSATFDQAGRSSYSLAAPGYGNQSRDSYGESGYGSTPPRFNQRMQSDPSPNRHAGGHGQAGQGAGLYPAVGNSRSRDTLNTNGASSGSEQWKDSTVPTSEESSLNRANGIMRANGGYQDGYGPQYSDDERGPRNNGYGPRPQYNGTNGGDYYQQNQQGGLRGPAGPSKFNNGGGGPPVPQKNIISLGAPSDASSGAVEPARSQQRSSWLKKRFSRTK